MNIGIDARMYGPKQTGIGNYIKYLIKHLERIDRQNEYHVFLSESPYRTVTFKNPHFHKVLANIPWYSLAEQLLFIKQLYSLRLDLMHFPHFNASLLYRRPFIVTIHDLTPRLFPGEKVGKSWLRRLGYNIVVRQAIAASCTIIVPSQVIKQDVIDVFSPHASKIHVIYEGIPIPSKTPGPALISGPYILYVGVWRSHKNLHGLIQAFALLKKNGFPYKLVLVGEPDIYFEQLKQYWQSLGLAGHVIPMGFQSNALLAAWYKDASLLVLPSLSEGFGLTPLIALSYGVPVAVSDIPVLQEILGNSAFYFNPQQPTSIAQGIQQALSRKTVIQEKLALAASLISRYRWDTMAQKTLQLYQESISH